jgi:predicted nucleotidyltransferase
MPHTDPNEAAASAAVEFARRLVVICEQEIGAELIGAYLIGSLAHAGFSWRYSDLDLALVTQRGLSSDMVDRLRNEAMALSTEWGSKLSLFWVDREFREGRLPPLDRIDYLDHAFMLMERERLRPARPTLQEIRNYLSCEPFANWSQSARRFASSETLAPKDHKAYLKAHLYPARFLYSWNTGRIGSNDEAAALLSETRSPLLDVGLIDRALQCRQAGTDPDFLFAERKVLLSQVDACAMSAGLAAPK